MANYLKDPTSHLQQEDVFCSTTPAGERRICLPGNHSANEKPLHVRQTLVSSRGLFAYNSSSGYPPFLCKGTFLSVVLWASTWLTIGRHILNWNSLSFPNKSLLLENYLAIFFFKVNRTQFPFLTNCVIFNKRIHLSESPYPIWLVFVILESMCVEKLA